MQTKLTLRVEKSLIERARQYARKSGKSLSQMVGEFFAVLEEPAAEESLGPVTRKLRGVLKGVDLDRSDYRRHLEEKYR